nr:MAG TPA_asm: hypothetical protein [Caudoviricetes sp.]
MIRLMQFCNMFNLELCITPHTSTLNGVTIRVERKADGKKYQQMVLHNEARKVHYAIWFDFENYIFEKLVEEFHLDVDAWKQLKRQWMEKAIVS